jgi:rhodanese-related sulfurtransferase
MHLTAFPAFPTIPIRFGLSHFERLSSTCLSTGDNLSWPALSCRQYSEQRRPSMNKGYKQLVAEANAVIETVPAAEAVRQLQAGGVVFIDLREASELQRDGMIPGAVHAPRGMLEFFADPDSPYHQDIFDSAQTKLLYCASGARSALGAQRLQEMGLAGIAHLGGGLKAWKDVGGPVLALTGLTAR